MGRSPRSFRSIYFDYAASTPVDPRVVRAMMPYFAVRYGNPGSLHAYGQEAMAAVDRAREAVAEALALPALHGFRSVRFAGSATEANNLALRSAVKHFRRERPRLRPRIIISAIEHESVRETAHDLERDGCEVVEIPVTREGVFRVSALQAALGDRAALVSVMYGNNEIGSVQPVPEIARIVREFRAEKGHVSADGFPLIHTDAAQAFQFLDCRPDDLGVDLMTISPHKFYGPKGIGVLYVRNSALIEPVITGGGQEFGLRSGTENVPLIVGCAEAVRLAVLSRHKEARRIAVLRDFCWARLKGLGTGIALNGERAERLPHILNVSFRGVRAEDMLTRLDLCGIAASAGSACVSRTHEPSRVLRALGISEARIRSSIRISFGRQTKKEDVQFLLRRIMSILANIA
jgi:cysteine desulfurase